MLAELVTPDRTCRLAHEFGYDLAVGNCRLSDMRLVEPNTDGVERVNVDPLGEARFAAQ